MSPAQQGALAQLSIRVGQLLQLAQSMGMNLGPLEAFVTEFLHGDGLGNPFALNTAAGDWQTLQQQVQLSSDDVKRTLNDVAGWTGSAGTDFNKLMADIQTGLGDIKNNYTNMETGLSNTADICYWFAGAVGAAIVGVLAAPAAAGAAAWVAIAGQLGAFITSLVSMIGDLTKITPALKAFNDSKGIPTWSAGNSFPEPTTGVGFAPPRHP